MHFEFGTAGIRARVGEGDDQLNLRSVRCIARAILEQLAERVPDAARRGVCLGFDGRADSRAFAAEIASVALARGFLVRAFEHEAPTPLLAFSTRLHVAAAGIMVTASHNPAQDNGIKLYLEGGRQVSAPHDREIEARLLRRQDTADIACTGLGAARATGQLCALGAAEQQAYLDALEQLAPARRELRLPKLAYTATCGVGTPLTRAVFSRLGAQDVVEVAAQALPRADFGGLKSPNPEAAEALEQLRALGQREAAAVCFAHDPDADRLAVLARAADGELRALSGDEIGALLGDFLLDSHPRPSRALLVSSLVSGGLLEQLAHARGAHYLRTATGFKSIAARGREHAAQLGLELLFGYEEALGYAFFAMADDKDGIAALHVMCELLRQLQAHGQDPQQRLDALARTHGAFVSRPFSLDLRARSAAHSDGALAAGSTRIMQRLASLPADQLLGAGASLVDHSVAPEPLALLVFADAAGTRICVRPSGTEPKLKFYLHAREPVQDQEPVAAAHARAELRLSAIEQRLRAFTAQDGS